MAQGNKYKYYLRYWDGANWQYYYVDPSIGVDIATTKTQLDYSPDGWNEMQLGWQRGWQYYGIMRTYSLPLKFVFDGAKILRTLYFTSGIEAVCELMVEIQNPADWTYSTIFRGDVDFSQFNSQYNYVTIPINEGGFQAKLKAREDTVYELDIEDDGNMKWLKLPSINLQSTLRFSIPDSVHLTLFGASIYPRLVYIDQEGTNLELNAYDVAPPSTSWFIRNESASTFDVDIQTKCRVQITTPGGNSNDGYFRLSRVIFDTNTSGAVIGTVSSSDIYLSGTPQTPGTTVEYIIDQTDTVSLAPLQIVEYSFNMYLLGGGSSGIDNFETTFTTGEIKVYHVGATNTRYIPALPAIRVFELLVGAMTNYETTIASTLLSTTYNNEIYITCGDAVRGLATSKIKTCFRDFFDFIHSNFSASLSYDWDSEVLALESIDTVFDNTLGLDIGEVKSCEAIPFNEQTWVNLKIGGPYKTLDDVNGKDAVNMTSEFLSPITRLKSDKNMVSQYVTEMYDIVLTAENLTNKESTDSDADNSVMAFHATSSDSAADGTFTTEPSGATLDYYDIYKKAIDLTPGASYWEIQNVFSPETLFNVLFTPKRRLLRNGKLFRSAFKFSDTSNIKFQTKSKTKSEDTSMITLEGSTPTIIAEGTDELISDLCAVDAFLWWPIMLRIVAKDELSLYSSINATPYKYLQFTWLENTYRIFIDEGSVNPGGKAEWTIKGLPTVDTDITNLIR